jgi:hypothetical protein
MATLPMDSHVSGATARTARRWWPTASRRRGPNHLQSVYLINGERKAYMVGPNCETWPNTLIENPY